MRRPSRQGLLRVCAPCTTRLPKAHPESKGKDKTIALSHHSLSILILSTRLLTGCYEIEDKLPELVISQVTAGSTIKFYPPFGLQTNSVTIAVGTAGVRLSFRDKLRYIKGRWTQLKFEVQ